MVEMKELLRIVVERNASDLHLAIGKPPVLRIDGVLKYLDVDSLTSEDTERFMKAVTSERHQQKIEEMGGTDFGFSFGNIARFRISVFREKGHYGLALRLIPFKLMSLEEIGLPPTIKELLYRPRGLILVTGPTGCGKTTTLAAMINLINEECNCHILTIEDPIEYYHSHKKSLVTQREVGVDVQSFSEAVMRGLRQDPDVILIGEMRDLATMEAAITAAETGHLVFATLHTTGATRTVDRIIDAFPMAQQEQIRTQLSVSVVAVISQVLLSRASGKGRIAAFEIMVSTAAISNLIREKKTYRITSSIQTGAKFGMKTMDQSLFELYDKNLITSDSMVAMSFEPEEAEGKLSGVR
jgi:twitching motility protein PilT